MARYEIVGLFDCPWYAKADKLADDLQHQFSNIEFNKTMKDEIQWKDFIGNMKDLRGWDIKSSPVIWEILVEPHGKVHLIGGINEFCEYVFAYFGLSSDMSTLGMKSRVKENRERFAKGFSGQDRENKSICNVSLINGHIQLLECFLSQLLSPISIVSPNILFNISIFNETLNQHQLHDLCMDTIDLCSPHLFRVSAANSLQEAMYHSHLVIFLDDLKWGIEENVEDWLNRIEWKTIRCSEALNEVASDYCRVIVGGDGPQCYVAEIFYHLVSRKKVRSGGIVAVGQHIINRSKGEISRKTGVAPGCIGRLYAYGWPGSVGAYIEVRDGIYRDGDGSIQGPSPCEMPLAEIALNPDWLFNSFAQEFLQTQKRQIENVEKVGSSNMCQAEAVVNLLHIWLMSSSRYGPVPEFTKNQICCPGKSEMNSNSGGVDCDVVLPVISVGIKCSKRSSFPRGTFMVQPAVCYKGKWVSAGVVSQGTYPNILDQVNKLWKERQALVFRDFRLLGVISAYDFDLACVRRLSAQDLKGTETPGEFIVEEDGGEKDGQEYSKVLDVVEE